MADRCLGRSEDLPEEDERACARDQARSSNRTTLGSTPSQITPPRPACLVQPRVLEVSEGSDPRSPRVPTSPTLGRIPLRVGIDPGCSSLKGARPGTSPPPGPRSRSSRRLRHGPGRVSRYEPAPHARHERAPPRPDRDRPLADLPLGVHPRRRPRMAGTRARVARASRQRPGAARLGAPGAPTLPNIVSTTRRSWHPGDPARPRKGSRHGAGSRPSVNRATDGPGQLSWAKRLLEEVELGPCALPELRPFPRVTRGEEHSDRGHRGADSSR